MYIRARVCVCARIHVSIYDISDLCISICTSGWYWVKIGYKRRLDLRSAGLGPPVTSRSSQACAISQVASPQLFVEALWMSWSTSFPAALAIWLACNCFSYKNYQKLGPVKCSCQWLADSTWHRGFHTKIVGMNSAFLKCFKNIQKHVISIGPSPLKSQTS